MSRWCRSTKILRRRISRANQSRMVTEPCAHCPSSQVILRRAGSSLNSLPLPSRGEAEGGGWEGLSRALGRLIPLPENARILPPSARRRWGCNDQPHGDCRGVEDRCSARAGGSVAARPLTRVCLARNPGAPRPVAPHIYIIRGESGRGVPSSQQPRPRRGLRTSIGTHQERVHHSPQNPATPGRSRVKGSFAVSRWLFALGART